VNDTMTHVVVDSMPFGGVGCSGMGAYHGKSSFEVFSHKKSTLIRSMGLEAMNSVRYPPYTDGKVGLLKKVAFKSPTSSAMKFGKRALYVAVAALIVYQAYSRYYAWK